MTFLLLLSFIGYNRYCYDNFHPVITGEIYRSAKLSISKLKKYNDSFHFKSMLNFCGAHENQRWYRQEAAFVKQQGWVYVSIKFEPTQLPSKTELRRLVNLLEILPKPLIFHCSQGADRTGMAAAISLILFDPNATADQIKRQASWHFNAFSPSSVGYQVMHNYFSWLKKHHEQPSKKTFLIWLNSPKPMVPYHGWF